MLDQKIENMIGDVLTGDMQKNALKFFSYLIASDMLLERSKGYWADKLYWMVKYEDEYVCFILLNGSEDKAEHEGWTIWTDDSGSDCFVDFTPDESMKEIVWNHIDTCARCGGCKHPGGSRKILFGKAFENVCVTAMKFINSDADTLACVKKLVEIRKHAILKNR